jgi:hypothetical protein
VDPHLPVETVVVSKFLMFSFEFQVNCSGNEHTCHQQTQTQGQIEHFTIPRRGYGLLKNGRRFNEPGRFIKSSSTLSHQKLPRLVFYGNYDKTTYGTLHFSIEMTRLDKEYHKISPPSTASTVVSQPPHVTGQVFVTAGPCCRSLPAPHARGEGSKRKRL